MLETNVAGGIAIIGMACRVAGANSPSELWDLLATSKDVQSEITRFNVRGYYHPDGGPHKGRTNVKNAYMMDDDLMDRFDNAFFHTNTQEAIAMDPQQRMLLEVSYEALESAGIPLEKFVGTDTAVYAGEHHPSSASFDISLARFFNHFYGKSQLFLTISSNRHGRDRLSRRSWQRHRCYPKIHGNRYSHLYGS